MQYWDRICDFLFQRQHMEAHLLKFRSPEPFPMKSVKFNNLVELKNALSGGRLGVDSSYIRDKDPEPNPMLGFAVAVDKPEVIRLLLLFHADINKKDCLGVSPLLRAAALDREQIFELFLQSGRADLSKTDDQGRDCEAVAKRFGSSKVLKMIQNHKQIASRGAALQKDPTNSSATQPLGQLDEPEDEYL